MEAINLIIKCVNPGIAIVAVIGGLFYIAHTLSWVGAKPSWIAQLPIIRSSELLDNKDAVHEGYDKYTRNGQSFILRHPSHDVIMLPTSIMNELKQLPQSELSSTEEIEDRLLGRYSTIGNHQELFMKMARENITRFSNASSTLHTLLVECEDATRDEIGECKEWTPLAIQVLTTRVVTRMIGRMVAGPQLSKSDIWLLLAPSFVITCASSALTVAKYPPILRPLVAPFLGSTKRIHAGRREMKTLIKPFVDERKPASEAKKSNDILQCLIDLQTKPDEDELSNSVLDVAVFAILTTTTVMTDVLLNLSSHAALQHELRDEVIQVLGNKPFLQLTHADLIAMKKLDSFAKETIRLSPASTLGAGRKVKTSKLSIPASGGQSRLPLPQGSFIATPGRGIHLDTEVWGSDAAKFDGLRFYRQRQRKGEENRHQFVSLAGNEFSFGGGPGACPGRFLVSYEIKIVLAFILLGYDVQGKEGSNNGDNIFGAKQQAEILFRRRTS